MSDKETLLKSLDEDKKGNWDEAHKLAQSVKSNDGSWVHAYLHRVEGDENNAKYWYNKAGKQFPSNTLNEEWELIHKHLS